MAVSPEVVDALYRALLGRPPDDEGALAWASAGSIEEVVAGFARTVEFRRRVGFLSTAATDAAVPSRRADRLALGRGLSSLAESEPWLATGWLLTVPWDELGTGGPARSLRVLGPYARELAAEAQRRGLVASSRAGLDDRIGDQRERHDVLVLTEFAYLATIMACRMDLVMATRQKLLCPAPPPLGDEHERFAALTTARLSMHEAGFLEVAALTRLRYGGGTVVHDVSHTASDPKRLLLVRPPVAGREASTRAWLVADRVPRHER